jgi:hypothetical protein
MRASSIALCAALLVTAAADSAAKGTSVRAGRYAARTVQCSSPGFGGCARLRFSVVHARCLRRPGSSAKSRGLCIRTASQKVAVPCEGGEPVKVDVPILNYRVSGARFQIDRAETAKVGRFFLELRFSGARASGTLAISTPGGACQFGPNVLNAKRI